MATPHLIGHLGGEPARMLLDAFMIALLIGVLVLLMVGLWWLHGRIVAEVSRGIVALAESRPVRPVQGIAAGATGHLAATFNRLMPGLEQRITRLERDQQLLLAVLGGMAEGVVAVDNRRRLLFANERAQRLLGIEPTGVGRLVVELIRSARVLDAVDATLESQGLHRDEIAIVIPDRTGSQTITLSVQGTRLPGTPATGAVLVFHDITEQRRLERVRQDFVANASHELKTPLASIKAYTETLLDWALYDEQVNVRFLHRIDEQAERLDQLVLDMLSLARLESGQDFFQHAPIELVPVIEQSVEGYRDRARARQLALSLDVDEPSRPVMVTADEEALQQILDNLIDNAIKYTPDGGRVRVEVRTRPDADSISFSVIDTGIGIPHEQLPRVFERFYRVDKARSRELGGTGLGLSIVKHLVQSLGGSIQVDSRLGGGSRFTVTLKRSKQPREEPLVRSSS